MIESIFIKILNMSLIGSYVVLAIVLLRLFLRKYPKIYSYILWGIVFFRMICPLSFKSIISLIPTKSNPIPKNIGYMKSPEVYSGISSVDNIAKNIINNNLPPVNEAASVNPMQIVIYIGSIIWIIGIVLILIYSVVSYIRLYKRVSTATIIEENMYQTDRISTPFVLGFIKPRIFLPIGIKDKSYEYIISHEKIHIKRNDYIIKPLYFVAVVIHWFNPLMWLSYYLMTKDMEMSCDEKVMNLKGNDIKGDYAKLLLNLSVKQSNLLSPIAFGENNTKSRIRNVLNYKKPKFWGIVLTLIIVIAACVTLSTNPKEKQQQSSDLSIQAIGDRISNFGNLVINDYERGGSSISGNEFSKLINENLDNWKEKEVLSPLELSPTLTVYINPGISEIRFYDSEPDLAMIIDDSDYRYYNIPEDTYNKVNAMHNFSSYFIPNELINLVVSGKKTKILSVNESPTNVDEFYSFRFKKDSPFIYSIYEKDGKYYCESPYQFVHEISEKVYSEGLDIISNSKDFRVEINDELDEIAQLVEENLEKILPNPYESVNPETTARDYIKNNDMAYENILKYGEEDALSYMLTQFQNGDAKGLRGEVMMILCKDLLGVRNNVEDDTLSAQEWYKQLEIREKISLPDFQYEGDNIIEKLVYDTEIEQSKDKYADFTIAAPHIFGSYEEGDKLKVFVTTYSSSYNLYEKVLSEESGNIVPSAITFKKNSDGSYTLEKYEMSMDGGLWESSIREFCVMPVSGEAINGLVDKIISHYGDYEDIIKLERENLKKHLEKYNQYGVSLKKQYHSKPDDIIPIT